MSVHPGRDRFQRITKYFCVEGEGTCIGVLCSGDVAVLENEDVMEVASKICNKTEYAVIVDQVILLCDIM